MDFCEVKRNQFPVRIDMHVHMVGNGGAGSGGWLRLKGWHRALAGFMLRELGMPVSALEGDLEAIYSEHLIELVRASSLDAVVLLAHERVHDPDGTPRDDLGSMFLPNDVVLDLAVQHPEFLAGVSIHPARRDAIDELERCLERGAVLRNVSLIARTSICPTGATFPFGREWRRRICRCWRTPVVNTPSRS
jgi:hypothetical protein